MNSLLKTSSVLFVSSVVLGSSVSSWAATPAPKASPSPKPLAQFELNAASLREQLLPSVNNTNSGNINLLTTLLQVHDARDTVAEKRAGLLPEPNLTAALNIVSSGPSFAVQALDILLPFLVPSNWFDLYAAKDQFDAEELSYKILELNTYSEALSVYYTIQADQQMQALYQAEATDFENVANSYQQQFNAGFLGSKTTLLQAQADADQAEINASKSQEGMAQEIASVRSMLGSPLVLDTRITVDTANAPASAYETDTLDQGQAQAEKVSPELQQVTYLVAAAQEQKWAAIFGFVNSAELGISTGTSSGIGSKNNDFVSGSVSLGFGIFDDVSLANRSIEEIENQVTELDQSLGATVESSVNSIVQSKKQLELATEAVANYQQVYQSDLSQNRLGLLDYTDLLVAHENLTTAQLSLVAAQLDLNLQRVNLHRVMLTYEFANIQGCGAVQQQSSFWGGIFGETYSNLKLEQVCREGGSTIPSGSSGAPTEPSNPPAKGGKAASNGAGNGSGLDSISNGG